MADPSLRAFRCDVLAACGAAEAAIEELLAYTENAFDTSGPAELRLPLPDEPQLEAWEEYARDARELGVFAALQRRLVQLQFPIEAGISQTEVYRAATRRGIQPPGGGPGLALNRPEGLDLVLNPTMAGRIPILTVADRGDFVALVRAFTGRNEPEPVPDSMGACIVTGLNDWDRVAGHRRRFEAERGAAGDEEAWAEEFRQLVPRKELYQDRFIILSRGPYSAVRADDAGFPDEEWLVLSVVIRREHECTHYFTRRVLGSMRNNLLDELIADFAGLMHAFGRYDGALALRFFGLESFPRYRQGGRMESYLGNPPPSPPAVEVLRGLLFRSVRNLETFLAGKPALKGPEASARMVLALGGLTLEELASEELAVRLGRRLV